jgi:segregation and condensation protein A
VVLFEQISPLGDLTIRWIGTDDGAVEVTDEFDVEREVDQVGAQEPAADSAVEDESKDNV